MSYTPTYASRIRSCGVHDVILIFPARTDGPMQRGLWSWNQSPQGVERMHVLEREREREREREVSVRGGQMKFQAKCVA